MPEYRMVTYCCGESNPENIITGLQTVECYCLKCKKPSILVFRTDYWNKIYEGEIQ